VNNREAQSVFKSSRYPCCLWSNDKIQK